MEDQSTTIAYLLQKVEELSLRVTQLETPRISKEGNELKRRFLNIIAIANDEKPNLINSINEIVGLDTLETVNSTEFFELRQIAPSRDFYRIAQIASDLQLKSGPKNDFTSRQLACGRLGVVVAQIYLNLVGRHPFELRPGTFAYWVEYERPIAEIILKFIYYTVFGTIEAVDLEVEPGVETEVELIDVVNVTDTTEVETEVELTDIANVTDIAEVETEVEPIDVEVETEVPTDITDIAEVETEVELTDIANVTDTTEVETEVELTEAVELNSGLIGDESIEVPTEA